MFTLAVVKFKAAGHARVHQVHWAGDRLEVKVPRLVSVGELRAAVTARTWVAVTTVGLYVTDGWTALILSSLKGHLAVVEVLLAAGADTDARMPDGGTALIIASEKRTSVAVAELLLGAGAD
jgi:hypothetical protein